MPNKITMPAGNTQTSQRKNALATGATTAHTQTELQNQIDSLNDDIYNHLILHRSNLEMLRKMVQTAIHDLSNDNVRNNPLWAIHQSKEALFIAQYLIGEFEYSVSSDIEAHPLYEREGQS